MPNNLYIIILIVSFKKKIIINKSWLEQFTYVCMYINNIVVYDKG